MLKETIVAIATPPGRGGVGIIRLSGSNAYAIATSINAGSVLRPRLIRHCSFYNNKKEMIDQGLMIFFKGPYSFTGEDVVEIHAHGSPIVLDMILKECLARGARLARPGEFSERAFLNDKIDLTQAEAIADLIQASSETAARMALCSLQGDFSKAINALNNGLIHLRLYVEAAIDFPEEEIDFLNDGKIAHLLESLLYQLETIYSKANQGALIKEGIALVIAGRPNAGKSTLINLLAGREIAIVTEVAGTTRDVMREHILLDDIPLHIIDTAGLHDSQDLVEKEGIRRAWQEVKKADCILYVVDVADLNLHHTLYHEIKTHVSSKIPIITVFNKIDTVYLEAKTQDQDVYLSAKKGIGIDGLKTLIKTTVGYQATEGHFLARRRHLDALSKAKSLLEAGQKQLIEQRAGELLAEDLRLAHQCLCEITGEFTSDDLLGKIFSSFCVGK